MVPAAPNDFNHAHYFLGIPPEDALMTAQLETLRSKNDLRSNIDQPSNVLDGRDEQGVPIGASWQL